MTRDGKADARPHRVAGDVFGELCLIEGGAREDMAEAMDQTLVIEVERGQFENAWCRRKDSSASVSSRCWPKDGASSKARSKTLIFKDVNSKLAELLLRLGPRLRH